MTRTESCIEIEDDLRLMKFLREVLRFKFEGFEEAVEHGGISLHSAARVLARGSKTRSKPRINAPL
jgi:hypothetical protein